MLYNKVMLPFLSLIGVTQYFATFYAYLYTNMSARPGLRIRSARLVVHGSRTHTHTQAYPTLSLNSKAMADHDHPRAAVSKLSDSV